MNGLPDNELIIDNFAGGGGTSTGLRMAFGRSPDVAINHDPEAVAMHTANHPDTLHFCKSIYQVDPDDIMRRFNKRIGFAWFSPDCCHHSKARGGKPREKHIRDLAWIVVHWAERATYQGQRPRVIAVENVEEFQDWGPLQEDDQPCPVQKGFEFQRWVKALRRLGYEVDWRELRACDYGAPTSRKRLFVVARCDGQPIVWPELTHGPERDRPYQTAADCIDWSIPCPSIFERGRPLADNTLRRIAHGTMRYVVNSADPFIVRIGHTGSSGAKVYSADEPLTTVCSKNEHLLVSPTLIQTGYGEREGQAPRVPGLDKPLGTVVAGGAKHALVSAFLAKHYTGVVGSSLDAPIGTVTGIDHHSLVTAHIQRDFGASVGHAADAPLGTVTAGGGGKSSLVSSHLMKLKGTCKDGQPLDRPMPTVQAQGTHLAEVRAFLIKYFGTDQNPQMREPMHTVTSKDRFGLVTVHGEPYYIADIGMRMLSPRELYHAQGFPPHYIIDRGVFHDELGIEHWKPLTKTAQVRMCGNSVCPPIAAAVAAAQFSPMARLTDERPTHAERLRASRQVAGQGRLL